MCDQATQLRKGIERQKDFYKSELVKMKYQIPPKGKQLVDLTVTELGEIYEKEKHRQEVANGSK